MGDDSDDLKNTMTGEEIVVTGMSGLFPSSDSVQEFMENLYNKVDMVSFDPRLDTTSPEVPKHCGIVNGMNKFDAQFFKVGYERAKTMEPMSRQIMEHAYGAIFDSGNTHLSLKNSVVGVFIGNSYADCSAYCMFDETRTSDSLVSGTSKAMIANRISYWMDGKGTSYCLDYACVSSSAALEHAINCIKAGNCDAAVVGGSNLCIYPSLMLNIKRAGLLCLDGKTKCFDKNGDGYVRSDAVNVIFLQKAKDAKRVYAEVCHAEGAYQLKANDQFLPLRKSEELQKFFNDVYSKTDVDPKDVEYVEANGAGLADADENEADAIANVFSGEKAVKLGCVKSNMGHSEPASGLCSLTKLCLAYHKGEIPANLHLQEPVQSAQDGKVLIVTENTKFDRGYTAMNNMSFTGASYHVILKGHYKEKNLEKYKTQIQRIVLASGRQESGVTKIFDALKSKQVDAEEIALLHNIFANDIVGHMGRGYTVLDKINESTVSVSESVDYFSGVKPPLWFVFSGMGSQWPGMGADLMRIPTFATAIERCHKVLMPIGIDIIKIITNPDTKFDNIIDAFVGIAAVQIGLVDILKEIGVVPDYIIGHSLGENACAYQDETLTAEQTILCSYSRGKAVQETKLTSGLMAAVGLGYKTLVKLCPPEIDVGCHNSSESSTISGPTDIVKEFVAELTSRGIFTRIVPSANIAYHSRYIAPAAPLLLRFLKEIIKDPKPRSDKWISTSVPREKWDSAKYSSAEYQANNAKNPVLFEEALRLIPENAVVVEIAPHGLLQAILKRSHKNCTHIPLTMRKHPDSVKFLLEVIGKLYTSGFNPKVEMLYPKVEFPVATETPLLSHLVEWVHDEDWHVTSYSKNKIITAKSRQIVLSLHDDEFKYLEGYVRNGVSVLPEAALLVFVWETLAMYQGTDFRKLSVVFKNIQFHSEIIVTAEMLVRLTVLISKGSNNFEITHEDKRIVSGVVIETHNLKFRDIIYKLDELSDEFEAEIKLTSQDIYKILKMRGFESREEFQTIISTNVDRTNSLIKWTEHWIPFLDSLIQLKTVSRDYNGISKPKFIKSLKISAREQINEMYETVDGVKCYHALINKTNGTIRCAGVQINDITYTDLPLEENTADVLESQTFSPYYPTEEIHMNTAIEMNMQIISENSKSKFIMITKVFDDTVPEEFVYIDKVIDKHNILFNTEIKTLKVINDELLTTIQNHEDHGKTNVIIMENLLQNSKKMREIQNVSKEAFILSLEDNIPKTQSVKDFFIIISCISDGKKIMILMKSLISKSMDTSFMPIKFNDTFSWIPDVYSKLVTKKRIVLISERQPYCGVLGFVKKLKATGHNNVSVVIVDDFNAPKFDPNHDLYKDQLQKNMTINIMRKGQWGVFFLKSSKKLQNHKSFALKNLVPDDLENVSWVEAPKISGDRTLAQVCYSGLVLNDSNKVSNVNKNKGSLMGMDFSGIDGNGEKVMGLVNGGSAASTVETDPDLLWSVPDGWSLEEAATVPLAYVQAYYCLNIRSQFRRGKRVLICEGTNCVGLALISLCLSYKFTVFTVVDSVEKKKTLLGLYPQLEENNIICSDNDSFSSTFLLNNEGKRCEYVINFATGACREAAAKCVGPTGFFLDFSKDDIYDNEYMGMSFLSEERSYMTVDVLNIFRPEFSGDRKVLQKLIQQGIDSGAVKPLSRVVFFPLQADKLFIVLQKLIQQGIDSGAVKPLSRVVFSPLQAAKAIRVLSHNQHIGKVLIRIRDPNIMSNGLETIPRMSYTPQDVLIIVCDEKGIGIELADRLIERGAQKIILHIFKKASSVTGYLHTKLLTWSKQEVSIKLSSDNLQTEKGSATFMKNAMKFGKVKGVFVVFDTKHTDNEMKEDFINAFMKQSLVVMNLDVASRNCVDLGHFIVLSRFAQSASDENSISLTERICDKRNEIGLPTLAVRYESLAKLDDKLMADKTKPQHITALFNAIETSLKLKYTNVVTYDLKKKTKDNIIDKDSERYGLYTLYKYVDTEADNVIAKSLVELPTLLNNGVNTDWDQDESYILLVPGFEGRPQIFEIAAERLKIRSVSLQLAPDLEGDSIQIIARNAREEMKKTFRDTVEDVEERAEEERRDKRFFIMGYSFGVNIALELAAILEGEGKTGVVYCLDSSPDALRATLETVLGQFSEDQLQNQILNHMYNLIVGKTGTELMADLIGVTSFHAKVKECLKRMKGVVTYAEEYKKLVLESAYNRIVMAQQYKPEFKLKSQLILMKSSKHMAGTLTDDYNLSKYSQKPVKVFHLLAGDPATAPYDLRVSNIINMTLDKKLIDEFKDKNLCDLY